MIAKRTKGSTGHRVCPSIRSAYVRFLREVAKVASRKPCPECRTRGSIMEGECFTYARPEHHGAIGTLVCSEDCGGCGALGLVRLLKLPKYDISWTR